MSAVSGGVEVSARRSPDRGGRLPAAAFAYYLLVGAGALAATTPYLGRLAHQRTGWFAFVVFAACAAVAQLFVIVTPRRGQNGEGTLSYHTTGVFLLPAALLLAPQLAMLVAIVQHVPEWLRKRQPWYIGSFNVFNYTLTILAALEANRWILGRTGVIGNANLRTALAALAACVVFVLVNHVLLATMFRLGRGISLRESGLFTTESLAAELMLAALGVGVASFWHSNPWLIPIALAPLVLINRSLSVPALQMEARVDPKTGLFNARHFGAVLAEELTRAQRFERPLSLMMADLDLLREINNNFGHLAGDVVLRGIADIFRRELRQYDIAARFGGEEFSLLLPETSPEQALEIAERIRRAVAATLFEVETSSKPIRATISIGIASFPGDGLGANELIHQADVAVYRAKLQGRNRVTTASAESDLLTRQEGPRLTSVPDERTTHTVATLHSGIVSPPEAAAPGPQEADEPLFGSLSARLGGIVSVVGGFGLAAGVAGLFLGGSTDVLGLLVIVALVGAGQALAPQVNARAISVSAVGCLAGAALFGPRVALILAVTTVAIDWSARGIALYQALFNAGALTFASLAAAGVFAAAGTNELAVAGAGLIAGAAYFFVTMGLSSLAIAVDAAQPWRAVFRERFGRLLPYYVVYGFIGGVMTTAYHAAGLYALAAFAVPLLVLGKTQESYLSQTRRSDRQLRDAAETIHAQNVSLEQANRLLKERSTAAMESLSATVDARDSYTAGHSRRVRQIAMAIGSDLELSQAELDVLGHAALFHDIGKLAIPDAILLKTASLSEEEWALMKHHAADGARIIERLGFLGDAVPAIKHHHERFDGMGYPDGLGGEEIPLGARIVHVADALDSMLTTRIYRSARPAEDALAELRSGAGTQFCPRCVSSLERVLAVEPALFYAAEPIRAAANS